MIERSAGALRRDSQIHSGRAEIRGTVDRVEEADVGSIEEVEGLTKDFQAAPLLQQPGQSPPCIRYEFSEGYQALSGELSRNLGDDD